MLTVYFTLLVAPLLVLADQELLLQIVTTNAPTALVKAAYNGLDVVYSAKVGDDDDDDVDDDDDDDDNDDHDLLFEKLECC
nr:hypothetical protein BaRGS_029415 [Batillaria attramentaria]